MNIKPIPFNTDTVHAILDNRKTVTRRVVKPKYDVLIKIENGGVFYADIFGEWCPVEGNPGLAKQRLHGRDGRAYLLSNEICGIWPKGIYGLVSVKGTSGEDGVSFDLNMPPEQEKDDECSQPYLRGISRGTSELCSSTPHGREPIEQCSRGLRVGDCSRELGRQKAAPNSNNRRKTPDVKIDRYAKSRNHESVPSRDEPKEDSGALRCKSICNLERIKIPFSIGQTMYVREAFRIDYLANIPGAGRVQYKADGTYAELTFSPGRYDMMRRAQLKPGWRPSIHMPREAARIFLRVTDVWVEQLYCITGKQARAEGFLSRDAFIRSFLTVYPDCIMKSWVWAIEFERIRKEDVEHG